MKDIDIDVYRSTQSLSSLSALRRKLAKRANQRLVRLERATSKITGEHYNEYGAAQNAYEYLSRLHRNRFSEVQKPYQDLNALRHEIVVLQGFLGAKSSLVSGQREVERKRIASFESGEWGTKWKTQGIRNRPIKFASNKEFYDFMSSSTARKLMSSGFTSDTVVELYDLTKEAKEEADVADELEKALAEFREKEKSINIKDLREILGVAPLV